MVTVVQISDTHLPNEADATVESSPDAALVASIRAVRQIKADLVLLTGDLADDGSLAALRRLRGLVEPLAAPVLAVGGNHDELANVRSVFGRTDTIEVGSWRVVAVESAIPGEIHGSVDVDELIDRLDRADERPTLIAIHHPPRSTSTHPWFQLIGAEQLLAALIDRPNVRAVASGHLHEAFRLRAGGLELCGSPSTYYAIEHTGDEYRVADGGVVGVQVLTLGDVGAFSCEPVARSLGC
jgi:Icc protein